MLFEMQKRSHRRGESRQVTVRKAWGRTVALAALAATLVAGCAPAAGLPTESGNTSGSSSTATQTLVIAIPDEPATIAAKPLRTTAGQSFGDTRPLFTAGLVLLDNRGTPTGQLAEAAPLLNSESWRVFPDGRMETTYRLRPNLTWHDGVPLSAEDFVFASRVYKIPEMGAARSVPQRLMDEVVALDARTVLIRWSEPYPQANALQAEDSGFQALPRHLLERALEQSTAEAFIAHPFWSNQYVRSGPYRLDRWEPGSFIEATAFDGYALGRPRVQRIKLLFILDQNTSLTNMLAGAAHIALDDSLNFRQLRVLQREWETGSRGALLLSSDNLRYTQFQFKPEAVSPRALLDLRVRKALAHSLDKEALNEGLVEGQSRPANSFIVPQLDYFDLVERSVTSYALDLRRAEQLMGEAGFTKGSDGFYASRTEGRFSPELLVSAGAQNEQEGPIMVDGWRRAGIDAQFRVLAQELAQDPQVRASFPGLNSNSAGGEPERSLRLLTSGQVPRPENRWTGSNRGGWSDPEYDRLFAAFTATLDRDERIQQLVEMMKMGTAEVAALFLYYNLRGIAHVAQLTGPTTTAPGANATWNVHEWQWREG